MPNPDTTQTADSGRLPAAPCYADDFRPLRCGCGGEKFREVEKERIEGTTCEFEVRCINCGVLVGYWAYGYYDPCFSEAHNSVIGSSPGPD